jgi:hypothetical protein
MKELILILFLGSDIMDGNRSLTLALVWQMMRAYTLSLLSQVLIQIKLLFYLKI